MNPIITLMKQRVPILGFPIFRIPAVKNAVNRYRLTLFLAMLSLGLAGQNTSSAQRVVKEYKIQNLLSDNVLQKFELINNSVQVYEHKEGNRLILVGDSLAIETAFEQLQILDVEQMMLTVEFMLVEYFHEDDFDWGIDITNGTTGNFSNAEYSPGSRGGQLSFGYNAVTKLTPNFQVNVRALVNEDKAKVLTNPHLVVESGAPANLNIIDRRTIVLENASINGITTTLQNIEAGIQLSVTPVATHDSLIHLDVSGKVSEFLPFSSSGEFVIEENDINTKVDVRDGQTLIIGGLIMEEINEVEGGVPFLRKIPLLGLLFKTKRNIKNYVERVIYITPYLHPIGDVQKYSEIRKMTPLEQEVNEIIENDPKLPRFQSTKKGEKRRNRRRNRNGN